MNDLLGGQFYVNVNQFAERDYPVDNVANQFDMDHPNRILHEGDKFGYDYNIQITRASGWAQAAMKLDHFDIFLAGQVSQTDFSEQVM